MPAAEWPLAGLPAMDRNCDDSDRLGLRPPGVSAAVDRVSAVGAWPCDGRLARPLVVLPTCRTHGHQVLSIVPMRRCKKV